MNQTTRRVAYMMDARNKEPAKDNIWLKLVVGAIGGLWVALALVLITFHLVGPYWN